MRLENMEKQGNEYIRAHIDACFEEAEEAESEDRRAVLLTEADFHMRELEHRRDRRLHDVTFGWKWLSYCSLV